MSVDVRLSDVRASEFIGDGDEEEADAQAQVFIIHHLLF